MLFLAPVFSQKKSSHVKFLSIPFRGEVGVDLNGLAQDRHEHTRKNEEQKYEKG